MRRAPPILCLLLLGCRSHAATTSPAPAAAEPPTATDPAATSPAPTAAEPPTDPAPAPTVEVAWGREPAVAPPLPSLDKNDIREVVRAHLGEVRACYTRALASDPALSGRVGVRWTIGPGGDVTAVDVQSMMSPTSGPSVADCIASAIRGWVFPAPQGGGSVVVSYPFIFTTSEPVRSLTDLVRGPQQPGQWFPIVGYGRDARVVEVLREGAAASAAGVAVTLVVHSHDGDERRSAVTDGRGLVVFTGLPGTGTATVDIAATASSERQASEPIALGGGAMGTMLVQSSGPTKAP